MDGVLTGMVGMATGGQVHQTVLNPASPRHSQPRQVHGQVLAHPRQPLTTVSPALAQLRPLHTPLFRVFDLHGVQHIPAVLRPEARAVAVGAGGVTLAGEDMVDGVPQALMVGTLLP